MNDKIFYVIVYIVWASALIPLLTYFIHRKRIPGEIRIVAALIITSIVFIALAFTSGIYLKSSIVVQNIYRVLAFAICCWFYYRILFEARQKRFFSICIIIFVLTFFGITFFFQDFLTAHQTLVGAVYKFILFTYAIIYLHYVLVIDPINHPYRNGLFWINIAVLFCDGFAVFLYLAHGYNLMINSGENILTIWTFFNITQVIQNILFAIGIYYSQFNFTKPADFKIKQQIFRE